MMMARLSLLKCLPRLASMAPFLCLIVAQWECPDMAPPQCGRLGARSLLTGCRMGGVFATHLCCQSPDGGLRRLHARYVLYQTMPAVFPQRARRPIPGFSHCFRLRFNSLYGSCSLRRFS